MQIDVSFQVWQRLTALLENERDTLDRVIERLIRDAGSSVRSATPPVRPSSELAWKGAVLPNGTLLRATYKGKTYFAEVIDGRWFDRETGMRRTSPSQAARAITGSASNGWLFWEVRRPGTDEWVRLAQLRPGQGSGPRP